MAVESFKVFLSFRGDKQRHTFVAHLYEALFRKSVYTFKDDERTYKRGKDLKEILVAIQNSMSVLIVLCKDYASSTFCLEELCKTLDCRDKFKKIVVPIFYHIDPSELTKTDGSYEAALRQHQTEFEKEFSGDEEKLKEAMGKLQRWREDLKRVSSISGWVSKNGPRNEALFIEEIVDNISDRLVCQSSSDAEDLVGMSKHVNKLNEMLNIEKDDVVRIIGIWGIDGIGKKTISRVIFNNLFGRFDGGCVLPNVGKRIREHAISGLREELVSKTLKGQKSILWPVDRDSSIIKDMLHDKKVLIVLQDVDAYNQVEYLARPGWFKLGSRIIITTTYRQLLAAQGMKEEHIYLVPCLDEKPASQLFCQHAFGTKQPKDGYEEPTRTYLNKVDRHPLALKILGGFLREKSPQEWESELEKKPNEHPVMDIKDIMTRGYDSLSLKEKEAFLDIACFFNGENEQFVSDLLDGCDSGAVSTLRVLKDKALITTSDNKVFMHILLEEIGHQIVQNQSRNPVKRSRLWVFKEIHAVLSNHTEGGYTRGIFFNTAKEDCIKIHCDGFRGLRELKLFKLYNSISQKCTVQLERLSSISKELRLFHWPEYPLKLLPEEFCPNYLVYLNLPGSKVQSLWSGQQSPKKLLSVDLKHSDLTELPDLSNAKNVKRLDLQGCKDLVGASSVEHLTKVEYLNFKDCKKLQILPNMERLTYLRTLSLANCSSLFQKVELPPNVKYLYLNGTMIEEFSLPTDCQVSDLKLDIRNCQRLKNVPPQILVRGAANSFDIANSVCLLKMLCRVQTDIPNKEEEEETVRGDIHHHISSTEPHPSSIFGAQREASTSTQVNFNLASTEETATSNNNRSLQGNVRENPLAAGVDADVHVTSVTPTDSVVETHSTPVINSTVANNTSSSTTVNEATGTGLELAASTSTPANSIVKRLLCCLSNPDVQN